MFLKQRAVFVYLKAVEQAVSEWDEDSCGFVPGGQDPTRVLYGLLSHFCVILLNATKLHLRRGLTRAHGCFLKGH